MAETNLYAAEVCVRILYVLWFIHCFSLGIAVLLSGIKLVRILNVHLSKIQASGPRYTAVRTGIFKVCITLIYPTHKCIDFPVTDPSSDGHHCDLLIDVCHLFANVWSSSTIDHD